MPSFLEQVRRLLRCQVRDRERRLLGGQRGPSPIDQSGAQFERTDRSLARLPRRVQASCDPHRARRREVRLLASQDLSMRYPGDLHHRHVEVEARQLFAQRFGLRGGEHPVHLLLELLEVGNRRRGPAALFQKVSKLLHRSRGTWRRVVRVRG